MNQEQLNDNFDSEGSWIDLPKDCRGLDFSNRTIKRCLTGIDFTGSKLVNTKFYMSSLRNCNFTKCDMRGTSFEGVGLPGTIFKGAIFNTKTSFYNAELSGANFAGCDMAPLFVGGNLPAIKNIDKTIVQAIKGEKATVENRRASEFSGDYYDNNTIKVGDAGALDMGVWHAEGEYGEASMQICRTTHCRGGWAIHLLGRRGKDMEKRLGSSAAAGLIYAASGSHPVPDWYTTTDKAWEDLKTRSRRKSV